MFQLCQSCCWTKKSAFCSVLPLVEVEAGALEVRVHRRLHHFLLGGHAPAPPVWQSPSTRRKGSRPNRSNEPGSAQTAAHVNLNIPRNFVVIDVRMYTSVLRPFSSILADVYHETWDNWGVRGPWSGAAFTAVTRFTLQASAQIKGILRTSLDVGGALA